MEPNEMAEELINKFLPIVDYTQGKMVPTQRNNAIDCAIICVQIVLKEASDNPTQENYWTKTEQYLHASKK